MNIGYYREYSQSLGRDMEFKLYGSDGCVCIWFPCQNGRFYDFENFGMADCCRSLIESGKIRFAAVDTVDSESLSADHRPAWERIKRQESYYHYIADDLIPFLERICFPQASDADFMTMGFSLGAYHAANLYFRRPDLIGKALCCSGIYSLRYLMNGFMDPLVYANSPEDFLKNMPEGHLWLDYYRKNRLVLCVGRGAWEHPMLESTGEMKDLLASKRIPAWVDFWGEDVAHDWYWWKKQTLYFLPFLLKPEGDAA